MEEPQFLVQWEEHPTHLASRLGYLLEHQSLVDVTLMCNTHTLRVHRAVLAACSPYFERQLGNHPLIVLKDMKFSVLKSLVEFMYCGETSVSEENLSPLLEAAKFFQVKGLASMTKESVFSNGSGTKVNGTAHFSPNHTPVSNGMRGGGRGRGRGRGGRTPISPKVGSPTESAQILLSLSGGVAAPQFVTTPRNVKIDTSLLEGRQPPKTPSVESGPRRRGRRRVPANNAIRERFFKNEENVPEENSPLLSSLLGKEDGEVVSPMATKGLENSRYVQTLKELGLPTNVPILYDNGQGKLVKLTEDVLRSVINSDGSVQLHVTETTSPPTTSTKCLSSEPLDKENKSFLVKEMAVQNKTTNGQIRELPKVIVKPAMEEPVSDDLDETVLETVRRGVTADAESDPEAVILYEICDNKKFQKCVLSAKDIQSLKELNEQLSKQKKLLADLTRDNISATDTGNTKVAELRSKIRKTTLVLSQVVEKVKGFKNMKVIATKMLTEEKPQSQVVELEFINGNGEKIEGYQVEGTVIDKKARKEESRERTELMGLLDMVCEDGEDLLEEKKDELEAMGEDVLLEATTDEGNDYLINQQMEGSLPYDQIDDMIHHSPSTEEKQDLKFIIDSEGNIINSDENYVVYKEDTSSEYVIYDGAEPVLPINDHPEFQDRNDPNSEFICEHKRLPIEVPDNPTDTHYIIYDENNKSPPHFEDSHKTEFVFDKSENAVERLLDKDRVPSVNFNSFEDKFETFSEEHCDRTSETSSSGECIGGKRRTSITSDSSDNLSKKQKLQTSLVDDENDSL